MQFRRKFVIESILAFLIFLPITIFIVQLTFTIENRINLLRTGQPDCLRLMGRLTVVEEYSGEVLVGMLLP